MVSNGDVVMRSHSAGDISPQVYMAGAELGGVVGADESERRASRQVTVLDARSELVVQAGEDGDLLEEAEPSTSLQLVPVSLVRSLNIGEDRKGSNDLLQTEAQSRGYTDIITCEFDFTVLAAWAAKRR